tara:strand:- start:177 stop:533 length:357 start_codon:yes stop_codon:yes gene_type:complete
MKNPAHDISRNLHAKPEANEPPGAEKLHDQSGRDAATEKAVPADPAAAPLGAGVAGVRPTWEKAAIDSQTGTEREDPMHPEQRSEKADARWFSQNAAIGLVSAGILLVAVIFILRELA